MPDLDQLENGFVKIANGVMDSLIKYRIPGEQMQCLLLILRKTYGWNKLECEISLDCFVESTGINKPCVSRALKTLRCKNIISIIKKDNRINSTYKFNKRYLTWESLSKKITLSKKIIPIIKKDNPPIKYNNKNIISPEIKNFTDGFILWSLKTHGKQAPKKTNSLTKKSCETVDKLIRLDGFTLEYIQEVLRWGAKDNFWSSQLRSLAGLRNKNGDGLTKFQNMATKFEKSNKPSPQAHQPDELKKHVPDSEKEFHYDIPI